MGQILMIAVTDETSSPMELRETADFVIRPRLLAIPGVAQVIPMGGEVRQFRIAPNPAAMRTLDIGHEAIERALAAFGANAAGGFSDQNAREYLIRNIGRTTRLEDLRNLVVSAPEAEPVYLHQIAEVSFAARVKRGDAGYMGKPAVSVSIEKQPGVDTVRLTRDIEAVLREISATLPATTKIEQVVFRQADFISTSVWNVQKVLLEAIAVVAIVLFAFLLNVRTTAISLTAIPVSILVTALVFYFAGFSINTMTLGGIAIAIGELVDDAVVDVENIFRRLRENRTAGNPRSAFEVVVAASQEVRSGILYATLIIVLVFLPLFALPGVEGRLFVPLGQAYILAILMSLLVSITLTPVMAYFLLPGLKQLPERESGMVPTLKHWNAKLLSAALNRQALVFSIAAMLIAGAVIALMQLPRSFLPPFNEGTFTINLTFRPGISLAESDRVGGIAERIILQVADVQTVGRRTGRAELDEHAEGVHVSEIEVALRPSARPRDQVAAEIRARLAPLPASVNLGQPISHRLDHMLSGVRAEIALKIFGDNLEDLRRSAEILREQLAGIDGLVDLQVERQVLIPQIEIRVDHRRAGFYGVQPAAIVEQISRLSGGRVVSRIVDGYRRFDVVIRLPDRFRSTDGLSNLPIRTAIGWVPASQLAEIRETDGPNQILRENGRRRIVVSANTDGSDIGRIGRAIEERLQIAALPAGVFVRMEGNYQAQRDSTRTIAALSLLSLMLIFAVLYSRYRSAVLALIILGTIPFALIGSVAALWISGQTLSVASMIGFITLTGIAARNGILKISHYINLSLRENVPFGAALVVRGSLERMTPVLMTALSAGFALIPLMIDASAPGKEILFPVAVTIFGGLISATLLDALLTPLLFLRFGERPLERLRQSERADPAAAPASARQPSY
jgi:HME family heavy-metal exporter